MNDRRPQPDLVVLSHLRWTWVWQRPQHLVSRFAVQRAAAGARTWFVEEPIAADVQQPRIRSEQRDGITRVWLEVTGPNDPTGSISFHDPRAANYPALLAGLLAEQGCGPSPDLWLYTPMAYDLGARLGAGRLIYDVMDDLASFRHAPEGLRLRQRQLLGSVEQQHYAASRKLRQPRSRKVAGYVGVIDERVDLGLIEELAAALPDWTVRMVGPVAKIEESSLPQASNISYLGMVAYQQLPQVMAGLDVALMPFALNEATRAISPTKTLEYLAAGLPVVSTRVPDVVADYADVVHLADGGAEFAAACREVVTHELSERDRKAKPIQARQEWDYIAASMSRLLAEHTAAVPQYRELEQEVSA
jgi:glycosyltransferase involved in cell wall biosynthesis